MSNVVKDYSSKTLRFSYNGVFRCIFYTANPGYENILAMVIKVFNIRITDKSKYVRITNGKGHIFEPNEFENYLVLFPNPETTFHVMMCIKKPVLNYTPLELTMYNRSGFNYRNIVQRRQNNDFYGAPVRRQNCFYGSLPNSGAPQTRRPLQRINITRNLTETEVSGRNETCKIRRQRSFQSMRL